jgi:hypothetical protein
VQERGAIGAWWNREDVEGGRNERRRRDVLGFLAGWHDEEKRGGTHMWHGGMVYMDGPAW